MDCALLHSPFLCAHGEHLVQENVMLTANINGKHIAYTNETVFMVQVGRYSKGKYANRYKFVGDLQKAVFYYSCINIGNGYKKRLVASGLNKPVLLRQSSY